MNFQRIVTFPAPSDGVKVRTLSWQLNETMLAAGYSNGQVKFLDVERESVIFSIEFNEDIEKLHFSHNVEVPDYRCPLPNAKQVFDNYYYYNNNILICCVYLSLRMLIFYRLCLRLMAYLQIYVNLNRTNHLPNVHHVFSL